MTKNDFTDLIKDVKNTTLDKAFIKLYTSLGIAAVIMFILHLDYFISYILTLVILFAIYLGRKDLYGHTTTSKRK